VFYGALAGLVFCLVGWTLAIGMLTRYGVAMAMLSKLFSVKSFGAALYVAAPTLLHALVPAIPMPAVEAATLLVAVHLFHMDPKSLPGSK
jgi:hypothetical protein